MCILNLFSFIVPSPHFASYDVHLLGLMQDALRGRRFADDDELKHTADEDLHRFGRTFHAASTQSEAKCVGNEGDFTTKSC